MSPSFEFPLRHFLSIYYPAFETHPCLIVHSEPKKNFYEKSFPTSLFNILELKTQCKQKINDQNIILPMTGFELWTSGF